MVKININQLIFFVNTYWLFIWANSEMHKLPFVKPVSKKKNFISAKLDDIYWNLIILNIFDENKTNNLNIYIKSLQKISIWYVYKNVEINEIL